MHHTLQLVTRLHKSVDDQKHPTTNAGHYNNFIIVYVIYSSSMAHDGVWAEINSRMGKKKTIFIAIWSRLATDDTKIYI